MYKPIRHKTLVSIAARIFALAVLAGLPLFVLADYPEEQPSSRASGLAYSSVAFTDGWSVFHNQGGLGLQKHPWVGVHHENRFIVPELNFSALGAVIPVKPGALGVSFKRFGFSQFSITKVGLGYGMKLAPTLSAGIQINAHHVFIAGDYGSAIAFSAEGGVIYSPNKKLDVGFHLVNPTRTEIAPNERIPTVANLGIAYKLSDMVVVAAATEKNLDKPFCFKSGVEFIPIENLAFRIGMATNPSILSFGMGYKIRDVQVDIAFSRHEFLGYTPHFSLAYQFGTTKKTEALEMLNP